MIVIERKEIGYKWEVHDRHRGVVGRGSAVDYLEAVRQAEQVEWREVREKEVSQ